MPIESRQLTRAERLIWTGQHRAGDVPVYNMALAMTLRDVDASRFAGAYARLRDRFAPLATTLREAGDGALLEVGRTAADLQVNPGAGAAGNAEIDDTRIRRWIDDDVARPFRTGEALTRTALFTRPNGDATWYVNQHHLVTDAWSCRLLLTAMDAAYHDRPLPACGGVSALGQQRSTAAGSDDRLAEAQACWRNVYRSVPRQDPLFGRTNARQLTASSRCELRISGDEVARFQEIASRLYPSISPHMSCFVAFGVLLAALLSRLAHRRRIGFEAPFANRATREDRETPGLFIELFPIAVDLDGDTTFADLGSAIQRQVQAAAKYAIAGASMPAENVACDAVLNYIPFTPGTFGGQPVRTEYIHPGAHDAAHAVRLQVWDLDNDGGLTVLFDLNDATVGESNRIAVVDQFRALFDAFVDAPGARIAAIPLPHTLPAAAQARGRSGKSATPLPQRPIIATIAAQAQHTPDATAIEDDSQQRSYAELLEGAERVAGRLAALGVGRGDRVCLVARRSVGVVETVLGILRIGAAWVPMEPDTPAVRRNAILRKADPALIVCEGSADAEVGFDDVPQVRVAELTRAAARDTGHARLPEMSSLGLDDLAYILFTSGSTGEPKGVPVTQMGLAVYLHWAASVYADEGPICMPLFTSLAFDLTVTSLLLPLISGGCVVVYESAATAVDDALFRAVDDDRVDTIKLTPSHLRLLRRLDLHRSRVRNLIVGGEQLTVQLAEAVARQFGDVRIFNEYGPTEAVVGCMLHRYRCIEAEPETDGVAVAGRSAVPIGRAADHTRLYVLNEGRQPVHPDGTGELYVWRAGAPQAYLDDPEATAAAWFPDLVASGEKMYRTGDLVRFVDDDLVYLGRVDRQIKVAGFRVEAAEVEAALDSIDGIDGSVVLLERDDDRAQAVRHCAQCGVGSDTPGFRFDETGVCNLCRDYAVHAGRVDAYFRERDELRRTIATAAQRKTGKYDCLALLSGGKDSTFALYQLVGMGFDVYALTLDNGYISEQALANVRRVVDDLGIDHEFATTGSMPEIFRDSLERFSNVCQGCFKTIYTLSLRRAAELGIPAVVTGLSRGQLFETRLNLGLFRNERTTDEIDAAVLQARKAYHRREDAVTRCLGNDDFGDDRLFEEVTLVDFYRYWSAPLTEMLEFLETRAPWIRPSDTGRSSNCLINDVGIHVHRTERGFHNYAIPYSWDVRLHQKDRSQAVAELNDDIDHDNVGRILGEIGYVPRRGQQPSAERLVAFYTAAVPVDPGQLREAVAARIPAWAVPHRFVHVDEIPLTVNGKVDEGALLATQCVTRSRANSRAPGSDAERLVADYWAAALPGTELGVDDNFFELGGTSLDAIDFMTRLCDELGIGLPLETIFITPVLGELAVAVETALAAQIEQLTDTEVRAALRQSGA